MGIKQWFCKHDFEKVLEKEITGKGIPEELEGFMFVEAPLIKTTKHIVIFKCKKCGAIKEFVNKI